MTIKVTYCLNIETEEAEHTPEVLGIEVYESISEMLLPDATNKNVTITRYFKEQVNHRWLVKSIEFNECNVTVLLEPRNVESEVFLPQTIKSVKRSAMELLRFGTIVEVDFGFKPLIYKGDAGVQTSAKRYPDAVQSQELHKRRPAIVLKTTRRGVQVVPLTSQEPEDYSTNSSVFRLKAESLNECAQLRNKDSYVLSHLIQTVGYSRILPPLSIQKSFKSQRLETYRVRVCKDDERALSTALANNVGLNDYYENKSALNKLKRQVADFEKEHDGIQFNLDKLSADHKDLQVAFSALQERCDTFQELLRDQYLRAEVYTELNVEEGMANEVVEYAGLIST